MKYRVLDLLRDIADGTQLTLRNAKAKPVNFDRQLTAVQCQTFCGMKGCSVTPTSVSVEDCMTCYSQEVIEGELVSSSGKSYPIVDGIPRLLSTATVDWIHKNQATFSLEWKMFRFGERNWGQDIAYRKQLFLRGMAVRPEGLRGKLILDAGCGSGLLSMELAESYGMEVLALDLAFGIEQAYSHNKNPFVHYVQASVVEPPVKPNAVDFIYCAGVLVAIPDAKAGFKALRPALKPGGRYFIWMYHPIDAKHHPHDKLKMSLYNWLRVHLLAPLPIRIQYAFYLAAMPFFVLKREVGNLLRAQKNTTTWREKMQDLVDMFSPLYQHRYTEEQILEWYKDLGLENEKIAYQEPYGFAARGDVPLRLGAGNRRGTL